MFHPIPRINFSPSLDLFDFDELHMDSSKRLSALAQSSSDEELVGFIREAGKILGIEGDEKKILSHVMKSVAMFKMSQ